MARNSVAVLRTARIPNKSHRAVSWALLAAAHGLRKLSFSSAGPPDGRSNGGRLVGYSLFRAASMPRVGSS